MIVALLLAAAAPEPAPQPPVVVPVISTPVPPPIMLAPAPPPIITPVAPVAPRILPRPSAPPIVVDIKILAGAQVLYSDTLRVDAFAGANYSQSRSEAAGLSCPLSLYNGRATTNSLNVRLSRRSYGDDEQAMAVDVTWNRPTPDASCESSGSRSATLSQVVKLTPGKTIRIDGDAGLRVEVRQR